jgi:hypothetical protein
LPLDTRQSGAIEGQKSSGIRANCLLFRRLAELSILNACFALTIFGEGYPHFSSTVSVENNRFNGFFLTVATGRAFCEG